MTWSWINWILCGGKYGNKVNPSSSATSTNSTSALANKNKRRGRGRCSKSRSRSHKNGSSTSSTALPALILQQMASTLKELECPICTNTCTSPIFSCLNGHLLCSICRQQQGQGVNNCPICGEPYSNARNLFAEQFISQYSQPCRFASDGCIFLKWKGADMKSHEMSCFYRPLQCIVPSCTAPERDSIRYQSFLQHLIDSHSVHGASRLPVLINFQTDGPLVTDRRWLPYYIKAYGCDFYLMLEVRRPHFWAWVWVQPPKLPQHLIPTHPPTPSHSSYAGFGETFLFTSSIEFFNPDKCLRVSWVGPVHSIRTPASVIIQEGLCFGGAEGAMQHFENSSNVLSLTLNIEKKSLVNQGAGGAGGSASFRNQGHGHGRKSIIAPQPPKSISSSTSVYIEEYESEAEEEDKLSMSRSRRQRSSRSRSRSRTTTTKHHPPPHSNASEPSLQQIETDQNNNNILLSSSSPSSPCSAVLPQGQQVQQAAPPTSILLTSPPPSLLPSYQSSCGPGHGHGRKCSLGVRFAFPDVDQLPSVSELGSSEIQFDNSTTMTTTPGSGSAGCGAGSV